MPTPYDSTKLLTQSPVIEHGVLLSLSKKMAQKLPFTAHIPVLSIDCIKNDCPTNVITPSPAINENIFRCSMMNKWTQLYSIVAGLSWATAFFLYPCELFVLFLTSCGAEHISPDDPTTGEMFIFATTIAVIAGLIYFIITWTAEERFRFQLPGLGLKKCFELNRKEGTVTRYNGNKVLYSHPFTEYDCYLAAHPTRQGFPKYNMHLVHRYRGYKQTVPLHFLFPSEVHQQDEFKRLWNTVQWYMDTSQPLPDISLLEGSRKDDPVTAEYDKKTGRKSHYWRNMTEQEYDGALDVIMQQQQDLPPLGARLPIQYIENQGTV